MRRNGISLGLDMKIAHDIALREARLSGTTSKVRADAFANPGGNTTLPAGCGQTEAAYHAGLTAQGKRMEVKDLQPSATYADLWQALGFRKRSS